MSPLAHLNSSGALPSTIEVKPALLKGGRGLRRRIYAPCTLTLPQNGPPYLCVGATPSRRAAALIALVACAGVAGRAVMQLQTPMQRWALVVVFGALLVYGLRVALQEDARVDTVALDACRQIVLDPHSRVLCCHADFQGRWRWIGVKLGSHFDAVAAQLASYPHLNIKTGTARPSYFLVYVLLCFISIMFLADPLLRLLGW